MKNNIFKLACFLFVIFSFFLVPSTYAQVLKNFTAQELSQFNGKNGTAAYFAYQGKVYDATRSKFWEEGEHYGLHAGVDLTGKMQGAPHGDEVLTKLPVVGTFGEVAVTSVAPIKQSASGGRIRIINLTLIAWTGILLGVFFILNFATCFVMPWSKFPLPWLGSRPGPDPLDQSGAHLHWTQVHKYFAWGCVFFGILHGILGLMQLFGYYV